MSLEAIKIDDKDALKFTVEDKEYILTPEELREIGFSNYIKELELDDKELDFDHYRILRKMYCKMEREHRKKGHLTHLSKYADYAWRQMNVDYFDEHGAYPIQKGKTYVREEDQGTGDDNDS